MFQPTRALVSTNKKNKLCELWKKRMAHFCHGALGVLREIVTIFLEFNIEH